MGDSRAASPPLEQVGDYRILRSIAAAAWAWCTRPSRISLTAPVALKVLPRHVSSDRTVLERFREARAAAKLHHTNIVPVYEVGQDEVKMRVYAMQFIHGQGLDQVITELRRLRDRVGIRVNNQGGIARPVARAARRYHRKEDGTAARSCSRSSALDPLGLGPDPAGGSAIDAGARLRLGP